MFFERGQLSARLRAVLAVGLLLRRRGSQEGPRRALPRPRGARSAEGRRRTGAAVRAVKATWGGQGMAWGNGKGCNR